MRAVRPPVMRPAAAQASSAGYCESSDQTKTSYVGWKRSDEDHAVSFRYAPQRLLAVRSTNSSLVQSARLWTRFTSALGESAASSILVIRADAPERRRMTAIWPEASVRASAATDSNRCKAAVRSFSPFKVIADSHIGPSPSYGRLNGGRCLRITKVSFHHPQHLAPTRGDARGSPDHECKHASLSD